MKRLALSAVIELPDDLFEAANVTTMLRSPWTVMLAELKAAGVKHEVSCEVMEVRAKPVRRPRKPRLVPPAAERLA